MFSGIKHTTMKGGNIYFVMRVPLDLTKKFNTIYIRKSLRTHDVNEVKLLVDGLTQEATKAFTLLRSKILSEEQEKELISSFKAQKKEVPSIKPKLLSNLFFLYCSEKSVKWTEKTYGEFQAQFEVILKCVSNRPIDSYDRSICIACRTRLKAELHDRTVNKHMSLLSSVFRWGVRHDYAMRNPAEGLMLTIPKRPDKERKRYDDDDIKRMLATLPSKDGKEPFKYWIPMIGMYSGMRREEICQLHQSDIIKVDRVWCFDVNDYGDKSLKTESSARLVPIHSQLIELGFMDFVESRKDAPGNNLWGFTRWKNVWGKKFGNWYSLYYQRRHITTDPQKCFHSFRHTVADILKQKEINGTLISELLGHTNDNISTNRYGKRFLAPNLVMAVESIIY